MLKVRGIPAKAFLLVSWLQIITYQRRRRKIKSEGGGLKIKFFFHQRLHPPPPRISNQMQPLSFFFKTLTTLEGQDGVDCQLTNGQSLNWQPTFVTPSQSRPSLWTPLMQSSMVPTTKTRVAVNKMRISCHLLPIEYWCYKKIPRVERHCPPVCNRAEIGDEFHYLLKCTHSWLSLRVILR